MMSGSQTTPSSSNDPQSSASSLSSDPPPAMEEIDRWAAHIGLQEFGESLQAAAKAVFPNDSQSRYTEVHVLILCWEDEDPNLPVSIEIEKLFDVFKDIYHFETEIWRIPDDDCHSEVNEKVLEFNKKGGKRKDLLKIVYYAGHAKLTSNRLLAWTSWRNNKRSRCPTVKWSGIQNVLEESKRDALILLDCCASGTANTNEGEGSTELISACAYNSRANGVGPYSFTNALATELQLLSRRSSFSTGELYSHIFCRIQSRMPEDHRERHPAPVHLVLTQDSKFPRNIRLSVQPDSDTTTAESEHLGEVANGRPPSRSRFQDCGPAMSQVSERDDNSSTNSTESPVYASLRNAPRLAFAIRLKNDFKMGELSEDMFLEWLRNVPTIAAEVKVEAGFKSFSTLIVISIPPSIFSNIPRHPAIISLGPVTTLVTKKEQHE